MAACFYRGFADETLLSVIYFAGVWWNAFRRCGFGQRGVIEGNKMAEVS